MIFISMREHMPRSHITKRFRNCVAQLVDNLRYLGSGTSTTTSVRFSNSETVRARKPASFWRKNAISVVILARDFPETDGHDRSFIIFDQERAQSPPIKITL